MSLPSSLSSSSFSCSVASAVASAGYGYGFVRKVCNLQCFGCLGRMRISSVEFVRKFSLLCDKALTQPLIISRHGRDRLVVMSLVKYRELTHPPKKQALPEHVARLASAKPDGRKPPGNGRRRPPTR